MERKIKPIKNETDYNEALELLDELMMINPETDCEEADQLMILATLIEDYEKQHFPIDIPNAVDAIKFRMEQMDLRPADLIPYLGSASRVSEILSGKRSLTVKMINALSRGLGIPEKALLKQDNSDSEFSKNIPSAVYKQMRARGYFSANNTADKSTVLKEFFSNLPVEPSALFRKSKVRSSSNENQYILVAWANQVKRQADKIKTEKSFSKDSVTLELMRTVAKMSKDEDNGPKNAITYLLHYGIKTVVEPALTGAKIDGVVMFTDQSNPIIGLSLRYDRLDNFWFTLMHELAHISLHSHLGTQYIYDDLSKNSDSDSDIEKEADNLASEALVDSAEWDISPARLVPSPLAAKVLADKLGVHTAIIAGKSRYDSGNWKYLSKTVSKFTIRDKFKEIKW